MNEETSTTDPEIQVATQEARGFSWRGDWQTWVVLALAGSACAMGLLGPLGSGLGIWPWQTGLSIVFYSPIVGLLAFLIALFFIWRARRTGKAKRPILWIGAIIALFYVGWMVSLAGQARSVPAIHDVSTDLADPPIFKSLTLRADNLDSIPGADDQDMRGLNPTQRWTILHQKAYGDIRSVRINQPVTAVIEKAARLADDRGWDVVSNLPSAGHMEATATTSLFRFKDDIVLRVRPSSDGSSSIVDMRSVSRVGQSDLGVNAKRVRSLLADLAGTVTTVE
jgi:Protein of unknown function (DUF1499)